MTRPDAKLTAEEREALLMRLLVLEDTTLADPPNMRAQNAALDAVFDEVESILAKRAQSGASETLAASPVGDATRLPAPAAPAPDGAALRELVGRYVAAMLACAGMRRASDRDAKRQLDLKADAAGRVLDSALVALEARPAAVSAEAMEQILDAAAVERDCGCPRSLVRHEDIKPLTAFIAARLASPAGGTPK